MNGLPFEWASSEAQWNSNCDSVRVQQMTRDAMRREYCKEFVLLRR
jgi:hypothetical protein